MVARLTPARDHATGARSGRSTPNTEIKTWIERALRGEKVPEPTNESLENHE